MNLASSRQCTSALADSIFSSDILRCRCFFGLTKGSIPKLCNDGTKIVPLDQATPKQTIIISEDLTSHDEERLLSFLSKNKDVFAWSALDLVGVSRSIIEHSLGIDPSVRPKKQRLRKMSDEKTEAAKAEVHRLLEANFIEPVAYPTWLSNVVMVQKKKIGRAHV